MIFITMGTQDKPFNRLLEAVQKQIEKKNIKDKVIVQAGCTKFKSQDMEIYDLLDRTTFNSYIENCDLLITHGGVGSIINGLKHNKTVIAAPRLSKYKEHLNDHQLQIVDNYSKAGFILALRNFNKLNEVLRKAKTFKPKKFESNTSNMLKLICDYIDNT